MRKVLLAGALALAGLAALPERSHAWGRDAYNSHGYDWLGSFAFRKMQWIHYNGPLFNYGPYGGAGHRDMSVKIPGHGVYIPADPNIGAYGGGYGYGAPGSGAPTQVPPTQPAPAPTSAPGQAHPQQLPGQHSMQPVPPRVIPAGYQVYPAWLNYR